LELGWHVVTDEKYRRSIFEREELSRYFESIEFSSNPENTLNEFDAVVCAKTPEFQQEFVKRIGNYKGHLFLEKPLSSNFDLHSTTLNLLIDRNLDFSIAYLFPYLDWYKSIIDGKSNFTVQWNVPTPPTPSWKDNARHGGGIASYYAVHFLPLLMDLGVGFNQCDFVVSRSRLVIYFENSSRSGLIELSQGPTKIPYFSLSLSDSSQTNNASLGSPFGPVSAKGFPDPRIPVLMKYLLDYSSKKNLQRSKALEVSAIEFRKFLATTD